MKKFPTDFTIIIIIIVVEKGNLMYVRWKRPHELQLYDEWSRLNIWNESSSGSEMIEKGIVH